METARPMKTKSDSPWLHRFAILTALATFLLLTAGAMVTTTNSGDSVPDWWFVPISFGTLLPPMVGEVFYEHGHRLIASAVGILTIVLAVWLHRAESRPWLKKLGYLAVAAVVLQGILGGLRVLQAEQPFLRPFFAIFHACLAQAFFCLTIAISIFTSRFWRKDSEATENRSMLPAMASITTAAIYLQVVFGAVMRHTGAWLMAHIGLAIVVSLLVFATCFVASSRHAASPQLHLPALGMLCVLIAQVALGIGTYYLLVKGFERNIGAALVHLVVISGHLVVGAALLSSSLILTLISHRLIQGPQASLSIAAQ